MATPQKRKSTVPQFEVSSRKVERAKQEDNGGPVADTRTRQQRGRDELGYARSYRATPGQRQARQRRSRARQRAVEGITGADLPVVGVSVDDGAGVLLGFLVWIVVLNYIQGGPKKVKQLLKAKLFNQGPDGSELP